MNQLILEALRLVLMRQNSDSTPQLAVETDEMIARIDRALEVWAPSETPEHTPEHTPEPHVWVWDNERAFLPINWREAVVRKRSGP